MATFARLRTGLRVASNRDFELICMQRSKTSARPYKAHIAPLLWASFNSNPDAGFNAVPTKTSSKTKATVTDSHFLVPLLVFCIGLALLILLH
jgi:hypothetical protein